MLVKCCITLVTCKAGKLNSGLQYQEVTGLCKNSLMPKFHEQVHLEVVQISNVFSGNLQPKERLHTKVFFPSEVQCLGHVAIT